MNDTEAFLASIYDQYRHVLISTPFDGKCAIYDWGRLPSPLAAVWMPYSEMFDEFSQVIANSINELVDYARRLKAWSAVMSTLDNEQTLEVLIEFVAPLATVALNLPYVIRSRFIYATAHLAHQANRALDRNAWKDDLPMDRKIEFRTADKFGKKWRSYEALKQKLEKIAAKDYLDATYDFRNKYHHRMPPQIALGLTEMVTRSVDQKTHQVCYRFGMTPPLAMDKIASLLNKQCDCCHEAFEDFKVFVGEQESRIRRVLASPASG